MKRIERILEAYEAPKVEVIEVEVEKGFAGSIQGTTHEETIPDSSGDFPW